jgi:hypothetical protein
MVYDVIKVNILVEVITSSIWNEPLVENMHFPYGPPVETRLYKQFLEERVSPDLHVAAAQAQSFDAYPDGDRTRVAVVENPRDGGNTSVCTRHLMNFEFFVLVVFPILDLNPIAMGAVDRLLRVIDADFKLAKLDTCEGANGTGAT